MITWLEYWAAGGAVCGLTAAGTVTAFTFIADALSARWKRRRHGPEA